MDSPTIFAHTDAHGKLENVSTLMSKSSLIRDKSQYIHRKKDEFSSGLEHLLSNLPTFRALSPASLKKISPHFTLVKMSPGDTLEAQPNHENSIYFIVYGRIKTSTFTDKGKEICFNILNRNAMLGSIDYYSYVGGQLRYCAKEQTQLLKVNYASLVNIAKNYWSVNEFIFMFLQRNLQTLSTRIHDHSTLSTKERTRKKIIQLAMPTHPDANSATISKLPTHEEIANMISSHREAVTKEIGNLEKEGLIHRKGRQIFIPNINLLRSTNSFKNTTTVLQ